MSRVTVRLDRLPGDPPHWRLTVDRRVRVVRTAELFDYVRIQEIFAPACLPKASAAEWTHTLRLAMECARTRALAQCRLPAVA